MGVGILLGTKSILTNPGLQIVVVFVLSGFCLFATLALLYYCTNESVRLFFTAQCVILNFEIGVRSKILIGCFSDYADIIAFGTC